MFAYKFPRGQHFEFMTSSGCRECQKAATSFPESSLFLPGATRVHSRGKREDPGNEVEKAEVILSETIGQLYDVMKSKMAASGK